MASYQFDSFKTECKKEPLECTLLFEANNADAGKLDEQLAQATIIGTSMNNARQWADTPANIMTPEVLAGEAEAIANKHASLSSTIFGKERAAELGMGSFLSVDQGTVRDGKFVILEYKCGNTDAATIALCGKGIMFDTGGVSLKPSSAMDGMKYDMSGAAATIATMDIIAQLKPNVNVVGITPLTENMPSGSASRQDDIVTAMNGKTIEIKNTDAEGRLVLADALCYAEEKYQPDVIIDIATLTGACLYALGHFYTAVMTQDEKLAQTLVDLGKKTGDRMWELPLDDDFMKANNSEVADVNNTGSRAYLAGTIIGACFLSKFVDKARWAHLDIAGTSNDVPGVSYLGKGATGAAIRALVGFVMEYDPTEKTCREDKKNCNSSKKSS
jgi:leucyl aminopeptidase